MENDTQTPQETGQAPEPEVQQPEVTEQATEETEQTEQAPPEAEPPKQLTQDEIMQQAEERAFQRTASWMGRREQERERAIIDNVARVIDQRLSQMAPRQPEPAIDPSQLLENPEPILERAFEKFVTKKASAENAFSQDLIRHAARIMDTNPIFSDKELGNEVVQEITRNYQNVRRGLPADVAAELLVTKSYMDVTARKQQKQNPLAGNQPGKAPGSIKPPAPKPPAAPPVKIDAMTKRIAEMFGNSDEEVRKKIA